MTRPSLFLVPPDPSASATEEYLTPHDVARVFRISLGAQKSMRARRQIPFVRISAKKTMYRRSELEAWIAARVVAVGGSNVE